MRMRDLAVLSLVLAAGVALPDTAFAEHRHSRNCGHRYDGGYGRYDGRYRGHDSRYDRHAYRGYGYSYGPRYSDGYVAPPYRGYGYGGRHHCTRFCRHAPGYYGGYYYDDGYDNYDYGYDGYSYAPPPRCDRRPRVGFYFGF